MVTEHAISEDLSPWRRGNQLKINFAFLYNQRQSSLCRHLLRLLHFFFYKISDVHEKVWGMRRFVFSPKSRNFVLANSPKHIYPVKYAGRFRASRLRIRPPSPDPATPGPSHAHRLTRPTPKKCSNISIKLRSEKKQPAVKQNQKS